MDQNGQSNDLQLALALLQRLEGEVHAMRVEQIEQGKSIAALQVKAGIWGAVGGILAAAAAILIGWTRG
jgi:hypothetical protein